MISYYAKLFDTFFDENKKKLQEKTMIWSLLSQLMDLPS